MMKKTLISINILAASFLIYGFSQVEKISVNPDKSYISYYMVHPLHEWEGISKEVNCKIVFEPGKNKIRQVGVAAMVSSFDSNNDNRDGHALEVLEAIKYPKVTFLSNKIVEHDDKARVFGDLNFHGITRPINFLVYREDYKNGLKVKGSFPVKLTDFEIPLPSFMLVPVQNEIKISFNMVFDEPQLANY